MKTETTLPTWDDIVFESRNKNYGAYAIRKSYDENLAKSVALSFLFLILLFVALQVATSFQPGIQKRIVEPTLRLLDKDIKIIPDKTLKREISKLKGKPADFPTKVVTTEVTETLPAKVDVPTLVGIETGSPTEISTDDPELGIPNESRPEEVEQPKIFDNAEVMPTYYGGLKAMAQFVSKNIHYPVSAKVMGLEGVVYVRFVVNSLGHVVDVEVIKGVSALLDKEAMRVVAMMNKWKPGLQHNLPVNVRMVLPIKFQLSE